jgi:hypothetical protein
VKPLWVFLIAFSLTLYGNGAGFMESFVNYPSWHLIGESEFTAFHQFITPKVVAFLVAPRLLGTLFTVLMLWFRPPAIPLWAVWAALALQAPVWIATVFIQAPIQLELSDQGLSLPLIEQLIGSDFWLRRVPYAACAGLFVWMAARTFRKGQPRVA